MSRLEIKDLSIKFGGVTALDNVSLSLGDREFLGLMGPNGSGKTTIINCISRIYQPSSGQIQFDGIDLMKLEGYQIVALGISRTFQDLNFFGHISDMLVIDYVKLGLFACAPGQPLLDAIRASRSVKSEAETKRSARRILDFFRYFREQSEPPELDRNYAFLFGRGGFPDLIDVEYMPLGILSFAWRRRLDLARALVSNPKLLLLDEPAQGLPVSEIENLGRLLKMIKQEFGTSALIVEHNVSTLLDISDRIAVLNVGKKIADDVPAKIKDNREVIDIYLGTNPSSSHAQEPRREVAQTQTSLHPVLEVKHLDLYYGNAQALSAVSINVFPRSICCVLGTNGSGKSSLLRAISGIEKPASGQILVDGNYLPLGWPERAVEQGIQFVPQGRVLFPELTVRQNLQMGAYMFVKDTMQDLGKALDYFPDLKGFLDEQVASLSGGQQQMVAIAQALMGRPKVLLLDEPTLGLAPVLTDFIFSTIQRLSVEEKCAILLVEQNVMKCLAVCDYAYLLNVGVVINHGPTKALMDNPAILKNSLGFS